MRKTSTRNLYIDCGKQECLNNPPCSNTFSRIKPRLQSVWLNQLFPVHFRHYTALTFNFKACSVQIGSDEVPLLLEYLNTFLHTFQLLDLNRNDHSSIQRSSTRKRAKSATTSKLQPPHPIHVGLPASFAFYFIFVVGFTTGCWHIRFRRSAASRRKRRARNLSLNMCNRGTTISQAVSQLFSWLLLRRTQTRWEEVEELLLGSD